MNVYREVCDMARRGLSPRHTAQTLNLPIDQVYALYTAWLKEQRDEAQARAKHLRGLEAAASRTEIAAEVKRLRAAQIPSKEERRLDAVAGEVTLDPARAEALAYYGVPLGAATPARTQRAAS